MIAHDVVAIRGAKPRASVVIYLDLHHRLFVPSDGKASSFGHRCLVDVVFSDSGEELMAARPRNSYC